MDENKIDKAIDKSANKIDGELDEVVQSRYMRKLQRFIILPIIAGAVGLAAFFVVVIMFYELLNSGDELGVVMGTLSGLITFVLTLTWLLKRS